MLFFFILLGALCLTGVPDFIEDGTLFFHQFFCILCKLLVLPPLIGLMVRLFIRGQGEHLVCICAWSFSISQESSKDVRHSIFQGTGQLIAFPNHPWSTVLLLEALQLPAGSS